MDKDFLLNKSKTFCMAPWVHIHTSPVGDAQACCISHGSVGNTIFESLDEVINSEKMKELRLDMLNERFNPMCAGCHGHEKSGVVAFRSEFHRRFAKDFDDIVPNTKPDGSIDNFKMKYFDIRFNNICNFKCRTCSGHFSTQWEQEDIKRKMPYGVIWPKNNKPELMNKIIEQIPNMEYAYFAGGEPLITEEHYIVLEEMIKQGRTDIELAYNSNISTLKFKDKDLLDLWSRFDKPISMGASLDHVGERAEYIRHGTDWGLVESNLIKLKSIPFVNITMNTVVSLFNYVTLNEFYRYLIEKNLYVAADRRTYNAYSMVNPNYFSTQVLTPELKSIGRKNIFELATYMENVKHFDKWQTNVIRKNIDWTESADTWETQKERFRQEVTAIDKFRGEDFVKVFPELASLMD